MSYIHQKQTTKSITIRILNHNWQLHVEKIMQICILLDLTNINNDGQRLE